MKLFPPSSLKNVEQIMKALSLELRCFFHLSSEFEDGDVCNLSTSFLPTTGLPLFCGKRFGGSLGGDCAQHPTRCVTSPGSGHTPPRLSPQMVQSYLPSSGSRLSASFNERRFTRTFFACDFYAVGTVSRGSDAIVDFSFLGTVSRPEGIAGPLHAFVGELSPPPPISNAFAIPLPLLFSHKLAAAAGSSPLFLVDPASPFFCFPRAKLCLFPNLVCFASGHCFPCSL